MTSTVSDSHPGFTDESVLPVWGERSTAPREGWILASSMPLGYTLASLCHSLSLLSGLRAEIRCEPRLRSLLSCFESLALMLRNLAQAPELPAGSLLVICRRALQAELVLSNGLERVTGRSAATDVAPPPACKMSVR